MQTPIRFFALAYVQAPDSCEFSGDEVVVVEITESCFVSLCGDGAAPIQYERHTMYANGVNQVCLTLDLPDWPDASDLDVIA